MTVTSHADEKELLGALRLGDRAAFDVIYFRYSGAIYGRLLKLTRSSDVAAELLQEIFVRVWNKHHLIHPELSFRSWLYQVAENEVYGFYRRLGRDRRLQEHITAGFIEAYTHTEEDIYRRESMELIHEAVNLLPPQRRQVFTLCKLEGKSYEEAADMLGISASTVSNHLVKAMSSVREYVFRSSQHTAMIMTAILFGEL